MYRRIFIDVAIYNWFCISKQRHHSDLCIFGQIQEMESCCCYDFVVFTCNARRHCHFPQTNKFLD